MSTESRDKIAELLKRKLEEIRERDGDLSSFRPASRKVRPDVTAPAARPVPQLFGGDFEPKNRLSSVSASAHPVVGDSGLDPFAELDRWRGMYRGHDVAEIVAGELGSVNRRGSSDLLEVVRPVQAAVPALPLEQACDRLRNSLWLVPGIRDRLSGSLCCGGEISVGDLVDHPRFGPWARRITRWIDRGDTDRLMAHISERGGAAHPLNLAVAAWHDISDLLFIDIETAGLFGGSQIIVTGMAYVPRPSDGACDTVDVRILVAATPDAEAGLVAETVDAIADHPVLVSFNGRSFDYPYICQRAAFYGAPVRSDPIHLDLLGYSRRAWRGVTTNCRLSTIATEVLGMRRGADIPGSLVPWFYEMYLQDPAHNAGLLAAIAIHNFYDMEQTVRLYAEHVGRFLQTKDLPPVQDDEVAG